MEKKIKVLKRDGSTENFNPEKIVRVATAAGLKSDQAQALSVKVNQWINDLDQEIVSSLKIRDKVLKELKKVNDYAANLYEWYDKNKSLDH
ncbi:hypothetical protein ISS85_00070 [Candidatus Microgenomates bacterium]|nr:hypothetical protein [Candidatus Microgenomates bacterium]